ncbi:MAG: DUF3710 domain-containing protein [Nocardioides sp.]
MKFRRKSTESVEEPLAGSPEDGFDGPDAPAGEAAPVGPLDAEDLPQDGVVRVDLGSLLIAPEADRELRLQVDETTHEVQAVVLAGPDGAVELRAFAAPRNGDLWSDVRPQIAADMAQHGGQVTEREGRFGTELLCQMPVTTEDGQQAVQPSRVVGINGTRWLLRATLLGRPAVEVDASADWEDTIAKVAVRRGEGAMPVGDALPVGLPPEARRVDAPVV